MMGAPLDQLRVPVDALPRVLALPTPQAKSKGGAIFDLRPPGSKSLTNRALLLASLTSGACTLRGALTDAEDTRVMMDALRVLGADVRTRPGEVRVIGVGGGFRVPSGGVAVQVENSGTTARFLAGASVLATGPIILDGSTRMRERPIGELGDALIGLGCDVEYLARHGFPPVRITPPTSLPGSPTVSLRRTSSSQFITALLMAGVFIPGGMTLRLLTSPTSASYVRMTLALLAKLGATVRCSDDLRVLRVQGVGRGGRGVATFDMEIEPDASSCVPFWAGAALREGVTARAIGLSITSMQGDAQFARLLGRMGCVTDHEGVDARGFIAVTGVHELSPLLADIGATPDSAMALAVLASFTAGTSILRGVRTLAIKESDRIAALRKELARIGVRVECPVHDDEDVMTITPPEGGVDCSPSAPRVEFETYNDHRMAMALALVGLRRPNTYLAGPACVTKTYPGFWSDWADFCEVEAS